MESCLKCRFWTQCRGVISTGQTDHCNHWEEASGFVNAIREAIHGKVNPPRGTTMNNVCGRCGLQKSPDHFCTDAGARGIDPSPLLYAQLKRVALEVADELCHAGALVEEGQRTQLAQKLREAASR